MRRGLALCLALSLTLSGCAGRLLPRPVNIADLRLVRTLGVDRDPEGVRLTVCGDVERDGLDRHGPLLLSGTGESLFLAVAALDRAGEGQLEYGHTEELVIGEALARAGIGDVTDFLERDGSVRTGTKVFLLKDAAAAEALSAASGEDSAPTGRLTACSQDQALGGGHWPFLLRRYLEDMGDNATALLPVLAGEELTPAGLGWLADHRLGGWFSASESRGIALLTGLDQRDGFETAGAGVRLVKSACRWEPVWADGRLTGVCGKVQVYGKVTRLSPGRTMEDLSAVEQDWLGQIEDLCSGALRAVQTTGLDLLHLRRALVYRHPLREREIRRAFQDFGALDLTIEVTGTLGRTYDTDRPQSTEEDP